MIIEPLPEIPAALKEYAQRGILIPFIGAGASRLGGCPSWGEFADAALEQIIKAGGLNYSELEQLKHLNPRVKLSIARVRAQEIGKPLDHAKLIQPKGKGYDSEDGKRLYEALAKLGTTFVTTNYDEWLDKMTPALVPVKEGDEGASPTAKATKMNVVHKKSELTPDKLVMPNTVLHIHGSILDPEGMIATTREYLNLYGFDRHQKEENPLLAFLENLFRDHSVLFIGYGLEDLEILEHIVLKAQKVKGKEESPRHFLLQGYYSHETKLVESLQNYYREQCGIEMIPFSLDHNKWHQLTDVIEHLVKQIPAQSIATMEKQKIMEGLLDG